VERDAIEKMAAFYDKPRVRTCIAIMIAFENECKFKSITYSPILCEKGTLNFLLFLKFYALRLPCGCPHKLVAERQRITAVVSIATLKLWRRTGHQVVQEFLDRSNACSAAQTEIANSNSTMELTNIKCAKHDSE
jgi:hypothetical protein